MPPTDAPTTPGPGAAAQARPGAEDTIDLRLTAELLALLGEEGPASRAPSRTRPSRAPVSPPPASRGPASSSAYEPEDFGPLLGRPAEWKPVSTQAGVFQLVPVRLERDLAVISRWMNDPAVAAFWELAGDETVTARHLRPQLDGDGRSIPCLGVLSGVPMSYWEIYRADLDPLARHCRIRPHDTGVHLLIGDADQRGHGIGRTLIRAVSDLVLDNRPRCTRVVAEPDLRNTPSVSAFLSAGFRYAAEVELPEKRAALMVRDRPHRAQP
ncbi:GNAT family N-acetyltransferase [Streptomyces sp. NPDC001743]|uniref:GNAT family N-acetyltransferase n=1 Tax=Streptomyces sp. NPDC001743 TaxID=3154397 RepID=UPI00332A7AE0